MKKKIATMVFVMTVITNVVSSQDEFRHSAPRSNNSGNGKQATFAIKMSEVFRSSPIELVSADTASEKGTAIDRIPFTEEALNEFAVSVRNLSSKTITYSEMTFWIPPHGDMSRNLEFKITAGIDPSTMTMELGCASIPHEIDPKMVGTLKIGKSQSELVSRRLREMNVIALSTIILKSASIVFVDGTHWRDGNYIRKDTRNVDEWGVPQLFPGFFLDLAQYRR